ncbi:hypothetical protein J0H33_13025 [bacterium]|nr:hypothetical protein [bacterium]
MGTEDLDLGSGRDLVLRQLRAQWKFLGIAMSAGLSWGLLRLVVPILTGLAIDRAIDGTHFSLLAILAGSIVAVVACQAVCAGLRRYWAMRTAYRVEADLRSALYNRVNRLSFDYHDRTATGQLMSRGSEDLHQVEAFLVNIPINMAYTLMAIGAFVMLLLTDVQLAFVAMAM